jgi:hypothetical protein
VFFQPLCGPYYVFSRLIILKVEFYQFVWTRLQNSPHVASITCMALRIEVQHSVPYVHTQNGFARSIIKRIKLIARPLFIELQLPT